MPKARSHEENRYCVCLFCFGKTKEMIPIKGAISDLVKKYYEYDENDKHLPLVLCSACKRDLYRVRNDTTKKVNLPNFDQLQLLKRTTRLSANDICNCTICEKARKPPSKFANFAKGNTLPPKIGILKDVTIPGQ